MKTLLALSCLLLPACGTTRSQRIQFYGGVLTATGHPEFGVPLVILGKGMASNPKTSGK